MLVELLRPAGAELARRWLACLLLAPEGERRAIVEAVEARVAEQYGPAADEGQADNAQSSDPQPGDPPPGDTQPGDARPEGAPADAEREVNVVSPPVQREGYVEQVVTTYAKAPPTPRKANPAKPATQASPRAKGA